MNEMKLSRKLIPAFAMLLVSAIMMTTASYAWFSINSTVNVKGMKVQTTTSDSILIATDTLTSTAQQAESAFDTALNQSVSGILNPVSTINAQEFFYTLGSNVQGSGNAKDDTYKAFVNTSEGLNTFNTDYGTTGTPATGYVEYVFQLKATNADPSATKTLGITELTLNYDGAADNGQKAFRVAVFAQAANTFASGTGDLKAVLKAADADYFDTGKAVASATELGNVTNLGSAAVIGTVEHNATAYYKVVVRLWLEGEDTTCKNDVYADLVSGNFTLDMKIAFTKSAVTALTITNTP
jgi:hypothetical protein